MPLWGSRMLLYVFLSSSDLGYANHIQRKLPWASTLEVSLTLALVNPALWYLVDRSKSGFLLSSAVGATGTALLLASNPDMMPSPASATSSRLVNSTIKHHPLVNDSNTLGYYWGLGLVSRESIEGGIWILSVLFCSCVCFGNIGRRLSLSGMGRKKTPASMGHGNDKGKSIGGHGNGHTGRR